MKNVLTPVIIKDFLSITILLVLSFFLISFYFHVPSIDTGYPDWIVHAYRINSFKNYGLLSWTHTWANGISLWKTYQFMPHFLTTLLLDITNVSVTQGMVFMTIVLFVFLRLIIYSLLRLLHFSAITSFVSSILSFDIAQYWGGVSDYSLMFGFAFFPVMLFLWIRYSQGKIQFLFPYLIGISFYMHPILGYTTAALWITGVVLGTKRLLSLNHGIQLAIFLVSSSLFWYPLLVKTSYIYTSPNYANKYFLNLVLSGFPYFGLSLFLLIALGMFSVRLFIPFKKDLQWAKLLGIFTGLFFIFILIGLTVDLPTFISQFQFTRGATLVGICIIFSSSVFIEDLVHIPSRAVKGILLCLLVLICLEGLLYTSNYSPQPSKVLPEPITAFRKAYGTKSLRNQKIWSSDIGMTSYSNMDIQLPYSYMGQADPNEMSPRISPLILYQANIDKVPLANLERLTDYFKVVGTRYFFFDETSPFTKGIISSNIALYKDLGVVKDQNNTYHAFESAWNPRDAVAINPRYEPSFAQFPTNLQLDQVQDQIRLDEFTRTLANAIYQSDNQPLNVAYLSPESLEVSIPEGLKTNMIYVNESYDNSWHAFFNSYQVKIKPAGPNFMEILLPWKARGGILYLKHVWPLSFYISVFLIFLIPAELLLLRTLEKIIIKQ